MTKTRTTISLNEPIRLAADQLMALDAFDDFSEWLEHLIRDKWKKEKPGQPMPALKLAVVPHLNAPAKDELKPKPHPAPVSYKARRKRKLSQSEKN